MTKYSFYSHQHFFLLLTKVMLILFMTLYIVVWSYISLIRYYSLNATVFDLGIAMQRMWMVFHTNWTVFSFVKYFLFSGFVMIISPISFLKSYSLLLIFQTIILAVPTYYIYLIARQTKVKNLDSFLIASSYLIYFPLAGMNFFDFHFQSFFILFFILGYYEFIKAKYKLSFLFFLLSGFTRFPLIIFPLLFGLIELIELYYKQKKTENYEETKLHYLLSLILLCSILLMLGFFFQGYSASSGNIHITSDNSITINLNQKIFTLFILLVPFLFINVISIKKSILLLPYVYLLFFSNFLGYQYPIFNNNSHYFAVVIPFVFLGSIEALSRINKLEIKKKINPHVKRFSNTIKRYLNNVVIKRFVYFVIVAMVVTAIFLEPYGPLNKETSNNYNWPSEYNFNSSTFNDVKAIEALIPRNTSLTNILIQDDLPMVLPRPAASIYTPPFSPMLTQFSPNINESNAVNNIFPILVGGDRYINATFYYAIAYVPNYDYYAGDPSMQTIVHLMISSGKYGLLANESGIMLLERNYEGNVLID